MRIRLDTQLVARGLAPSREKAKRLILAGAVRANGQVAAKPSDLVEESTRLEVSAAEKFVSRGGHKLEAALEAWNVDCRNKVCVDIGASTGGFTDCLLQRSAQRVHAVDVGKGQLDWKLRRDPRVIVHEKLNARNLTQTDIGEMVDLVTIDVSFISLQKVLAAGINVLKADGILIALIKPQFEAGRKQVRKGGVVRDPHVHEQVIATLTTFATESLGMRLVGVIDSPLLGPAGNKEFLMGLNKP